MASKPGEVFQDPGLSWSQLRAFSACARLSSFNGAATALNLTAAAVRHQVALLEARLGAQLFQRQGGRISLTQIGSAFAREIDRPMRDLLRACASAGRAALAAPITLTAPPLFAREFLFDSRFLAWCDENLVQLDVTDTRRDLFAPTPIAAVRLGAEADPELSRTQLLDVELVLAAVPALASQARVRDPGWWRRQVLLSPKVSDPAWPLAWRALRLADVAPARVLRFTSYAAALEEARAGRGVILAALPFVAAEFTANRLRPISDLRIPSPIGYSLVMRRELAATPKGRALRRRVLATTQR